MQILQYVLLALRVIALSGMTGADILVRQQIWKIVNMVCVQIVAWAMNGCMTAGPDITVVPRQMVGSFVHKTEQQPHLLVLVMKWGVR